MATGALSTGDVTTTSININYSYSGCQMAALYKGGSYTILDAGSNTGSKTYTGLQPNTNYTFYLKDIGDPGIPTLASRTIRTLAEEEEEEPPPPPPPPPPPTPSGTLSASATSSTVIRLNYSYKDGTNVSLFRGSTKLKTFGSGNGSGVYNDTGRTPNTTYSYYLRNGTSTGSTLLASASAKTPVEPEGTLSGEATSPYRVKLTYSYVDGTNVSIFKGSTKLITLGSGTNSGDYTATGLTPGITYTFYLRNGTTSESEQLGKAIITTPLPEGTLSAQVVDSATIDLTYSFSGGINVSLFRDREGIKTFGSGSGSGVYRNTDLTPDTSYSYALRNGTSSSDLLLASASAKTLKEARKSIIEQGKILPLSSEIHIFDSTLTRVGIIENYEYLYWNYKYRSPGNFKLIINRYKTNVEYLIKGNILALYIAGYYRAAVIESIEIGLNEKGKISENYIIAGRGLGGLLSERIALHNTASGTGYDSQNTYASTAMRHYVNVNAMDATDTDRNYPLLHLEDPDPEAGGSIKYDARFQVISELLEEISLASGIGWEVVLDPTEKKLVFLNIVGVDRSFENGANSVVMFSPEFGNIRLISFSDSNIGSKNIAYVAGQGEADDRTIQEVTKDAGTYTGMDRREFLIDARDLDETAKLTQRGNERLAELGEEKIVEMENLSTGPFSYGEDFYLGDIVTVIYPDIVEADLRLIESTIEITPQKLIKNKLIFGKSYPDLINIREFKDKNYLTETRR
jgi:hypothetical protein